MHHINALFRQSLLFSSVIFGYVPLFFPLKEVESCAVFVIIGYFLYFGHVYVINACYLFLCFIYLKYVAFIVNCVRKGAV